MQSEINMSEVKRPSKAMPFIINNNVRMESNQERQYTRYHTNSMRQKEEEERKKRSLRLRKKKCREGEREREATVYNR